MTPAEERPPEQRPAASEPTSPSPPASGGEPTTGPAPSPSGLESWPGSPPVERSPSISPTPRASHADRNAVAEQLRDAFADGRLDEEEFDVRIQAALSARTRDELEPLLADLVAVGTPLPFPAQAPSVPVASGRAPRHGFVVAVMGGAERKGRWRVPEEATALALMGGIDLDLRAATLTSPVTTLRVAAIMGGVDITVPPGVRVEMTGIPLMGGGDNRVDDEHLPPTAPLIKVQYLAIMGGVSVRTKAPRPPGRDGRQLADDRRERQLRAREQRLEQRLELRQERHELRRERHDRRGQGWELED